MPKDNTQTARQAQYALDIMRSQEGMDRRQRMQKRLDYYFGDKQVEYLDELLNDQFTYPDRLKLQKEIHNLTEMIINEAAVLYNEEPYREIVKEDPEADTEKDSKAYSTLIDESKINSVMKTAQRLTKLCKTTLVRSAWRDGHIEYDIYTPNMFDVIQDPTNRTKALAVIYSSTFDFESLKDEETGLDEDRFQNEDAIFYYWSMTEHFIFSAGFDAKKNKWIATLLAQEGNPENKNPYGALPFVILRDGIPVDTFFLPGGDELITVNEINNVKITEKNNLTKMQSFSIPVRKGAQTGGSFILDPSMTVDLPADDDLSKGSDFRFVSPDPKIKDVADDIDGRVRRIAIKYNLNPERFTASAQKSSADALQLRAFDQAKQIKADKPDWRGFEKDLFELTKLVNNYHNPNLKYDDDSELFIDYADVETPMTAAEQDAHNLLMVENDIMSRAEWLMAENPDIRSIEEADQRLADNQAKKAEELKTKQAEFIDRSRSMMSGAGSDQGQGGQENNQDTQNQDDTPGGE